ncbi:MAG: hypothetical protein ACD_56C00055G0007 [uncultured bacterium]|nr:MAG: hypothetical protein ACD_56C00055G0007 [uncultured bacterium]
MKNKIQVGLVFGGKSSEHGVSLISGWNIYNGFDKNKYEIIPIGISKDGLWYQGINEGIWINSENPKTVSIDTSQRLITVVRRGMEIWTSGVHDGKFISRIDIFFPITHGTFGEDGCLQGFFETLGADYVGPGVLGSAVSMDKDVSKRLLRDAGIKQSKFHTIRKSEKNNDVLINKIIKDLKFPIFVKPANQGSSVGVSKSENKIGLKKSITQAFKFDKKVILEEAIKGREIECAILGNENPIASELGEIVLTKGFYSYDAKYIEEDAAKPVVGIKLPNDVKNKIQKTAIEVYKILECEGLSRVDFFLTNDNKIYVNEINTLPGFTNISMYPKLMEFSGVKYAKLLDKLVTLAMKK